MVPVRGFPCIRSPPWQLRNSEKPHQGGIGSYVDAFSVLLSGWIGTFCQEVFWGHLPDGSRMRVALSVLPGLVPLGQPHCPGTQPTLPGLVVLPFGEPALHGTHSFIFSEAGCSRAKPSPLCSPSQKTEKDFIFSLLGIGLKWVGGGMWRRTVIWRPCRFWGERGSVWRK